MTEHTLTLGKRRVVTVDFEIKEQAWKPYDHGKGRTAYAPSLRSYVHQELPCSCGGWAEVLSVHQPFQQSHADIAIKHLPPGRCRGCGREDAQGSHYTGCTLLEVGDILVNYAEETVGTVGQRESGEFYLIPTEAAS